MNLKPYTKGDLAAFWHDVKSFGGIIRDVLNNKVFSYQSVISFLETNDPFELFAAPFITFFGTPANVLSELVEAGGDLFHGFTSGFQNFFSGTQQAFEHLWQGNFFAAAQSFLSGAWNAITSFVQGIGNAISHLWPVILDLDGDGVELLPNDLAQSVTLFEADGVHFVRGGWVAADDGVVAIDLNGDGRVSSMDEFVFTRLDPTAKSDLEALRVVDSNGDGVLDAEDPVFSRLLLWQDANTNGVSDPGEAISFAEAGITSLSLSLDTPVDLQVAGHEILHLSTFTRADGTVGTAADVVFNIDSPVYVREPAPESGDALLPFPTSLRSEVEVFVV